MRSQFQIAVMRLASLLFSLLLVSSFAAAQQPIAAPNAGVAQAQQTRQGARDQIIKESESVPTPKLPDGHVDLTGRWTNAQVVCDKSGNCKLATGAALTGYVRYVSKDGIVHADRPTRELPSEVKSTYESETSSRYFELFDGDARRAANPNKPPYKPELMAKVADLDLHENEVDPHILCHPDGPREGPPGRIMESPGMLAFLYANGENGNYWRVIPTDGRKHRDDLDPSYFGDSVSHWEGDTLVVDTTGYNDDSWLGGDGWFHSEDLHMVEHISRKGNILHYQVTFEDPQVFTRPWIKEPVTLILNTAPDSEIAEVPRCQNEDIGHIVNHDHF
jgi:hypothetical protein